VLIANSENQFAQFRKRLYHKHLNKRKNTQIHLIDALCSNTHKGSVVELCLNPVFSQGYSSLYKGVTDYQFIKGQMSLAELAAPYLPSLWKGKFRLLGKDTTSCPRPYAFKLSERECIYKPTPIKGQKPITYGHGYSLECALAGKKGMHAPSWVNPLSCQRVSREDKEQSGIEQLRDLLENPQLPFCHELCVEVGDTDYSTPTYLGTLADIPNLIRIVRSRSNRVYDFPMEPVETTKRGHARWYTGKRMKLGDPSTWPEPTAALSLLKANRKGQTERVEVQAWNNVVMRGKWKKAKLPMHKYPFTLVLIRIYNAKGELRYPDDPLWLIVMGQERQQLSLVDIYEAFYERGGMEHFFRFAKQNLLLDKFQTCETAHEENWWQIVCLAYLQLWVAKEHAICLPRPWEKHLPQVKERHLSATMVQRSFAEIIQQFEPLSRLTKPRNKSPGSLKGRVTV
jgi:hypothetical protein